MDLIRCDGCDRELNRLADTYLELERSGVQMDMLDEVPGPRHFHDEDCLSAWLARRKPGEESGGRFRWHEPSPLEGPWARNLITPPEECPTCSKMAAARGERDGWDNVPVDSLPEGAEYVAEAKPRARVRFDWPDALEGVEWAWEPPHERRRWMDRVLAWIKGGQDG